MQVADEDIAGLIAKYASAAGIADGDLRAMEKCKLLDQLAPAAAYSDAALAAVAGALADEDGYEAGASPYDAWYEIVAEHAYGALLPIVARAEGLIVAQLEQSLRRGDDAVRLHGTTPSEKVLNRTGVHCRRYAANLLERLPVLCPSAIDALIRCASDPSNAVQQAVGMALRGRIDVSVLLANPETRQVGLIASATLGESQLVELLHDDSDSVRSLALRRLHEIKPTPVEVAMRLIECLNDQSDNIVHDAADALELALDDMAVTEALFKAGRKGSDRRRRYQAMRVLANRPATHLARLMPDVLEWFLSSEEDNPGLAAALDAVGDQMPVEIERALKEHLASQAGNLRQLRAALHALRNMVRMARLVLPQVEAMKRHPDASIRSAASRLASAVKT